MIDALLFAARDTIREAGWGYDTATCEITDAGQPPARGKGYFVSVTPTATSSEMDNALDEYFSFDLVLTLWVHGVPPDRVGDRLLAANRAREPGPNGMPSFNARAEQLRSLHHMGWAVIARANNYLADWEVQAQGPTYGFAEPARYRGMEKPRLEGAAWLSADPEAEDVALVAPLHFADARRLQPLQTFL